MAFGVFRPYPYRLLWRRRVIFTQARGSALIHLPDASETCDGKRLYFDFYMVDNVNIIFRATNGNQIRLGSSLSSADGDLVIAAVGDTGRITALNDDLWGVSDATPGGGTLSVT